MSAGPRVRGMAAVIALTAFVLGATATQRMRDPARRGPENLPPPTLTMHTERFTPDGNDCTKEAVVARGKVPAHVRRVVGLRVVADRSVPMAFFDEALRERGTKHCVDGVTIVAAVADKDPRQILEATAVGWVKTTPVPTGADGGSQPDIGRRSVDGGSLPLEGPAPF